MSELSIKTPSRKVQIATADAALAAPSAAPSSDEFASWRIGGKCPRVAQLSILKNDGTGDITISGAYLSVYDPDLAEWCNAGQLNQGNDITVGDALGWTAEVFDIPAVATAARVVGTPGGTSPKFDIYLTPIEVVG